jgi:polyisoprenoid-binding protein YceI
VDLEKSSVNWKGEMLGLYSHFGTVSIKSAYLTLAGGEVSGGSFVINLNTITPTDENYSKDRPRQKLIGHLFSDDFFDLANYPAASFEISEANGSEVTGMMTIRGNTHPETFTDITITRERDTYRIRGKAILDRKKYNVSFSTMVPDRVISDDFELEIDLVAS